MLNTDHNKLRLMNELHKALNVPWWDLDFVRDIDHENPKMNIESKLLNEICLAFRITKKGGIKSTYNELYKALLDLYKHMWADLMVSTKRSGKTIKGKKYYFKIINQEALNILKNIYNVKQKQKEILNQYQEYCFI